MLVQTLGVSVWISAGSRRRVEVLDSATEAARLSGNTQALAWNQLNASMVLWVIGEHDGAVAAARESVGYARDSGQRFVYCLAGAALAARRSTPVASRAGWRRSPSAPAGRICR